MNVQPQAKGAGAKVKIRQKSRPICDSAPPLIGLPNPRCPVRMNAILLDFLADGE